MIKYENLKSENVENPEKVIEDFSLLLYGNTSGSIQIDEMIEKAIKHRKVKLEEPKYILYTWVTIDDIYKKYYKACGSVLTTKKSSAWVYTESELKRCEAYKELYEFEKIEDGEFDND